MTSGADTEFDRAQFDRLVPLAGTTVEGGTDGRGLRVGVACARFNGAITTRLLEATLNTLHACGVERADITVAWTPGAFELPLLAHAFATGPVPVDAVITLGAVIRGDTGHYDVVAGECARGVQQVQLTTGVPVVFGVLTTNTVDQALERSHPDETNKGRESALTALEMANVLRANPFAR